ncbi:hypothetical protein DL93DRAFT_604418 [Clavulina sp. PMI_390]|nr:hypothetical protein DL93DRAFT_604418 [Clavulina sp. PMI_390]
MTTTPSFEIRGAVYASDLIKKSRTYRLLIEWNPPDIQGKSNMKTRKVRASVNGRVEWVPLSGLKRFFTSLPPQISITVQRRELLLRKTLTRHQISSTADHAMSERIDNVLALDLVILGCKTNATQVETTAHAAADHEPNRASLDVHGSLPLDHSQETGQAAVKIAQAEDALGVPKAGRTLDNISSAADQLAPLKNDFESTVAAVEGLFKLGGLVAQIHPIVQVIVGVLNTAWTILQADAEANQSMHTLLQAMKDICVSTASYFISQEPDDRMHVAVRNICSVIMSGATLINGYAEHQKKTFPKLPTFFTAFAQDADNLTQALKSLSSELKGTAIASIYNTVHELTAQLHVIGVGIEQIVKHDMFSALPHTVNADATLHDGNHHGCLPDTRTAILEALQAWAAGASATVALNPGANLSNDDKLDLIDTKILWLQGVAGAGKSSIANSVAKFFEHTGILMAYYHFETAKQEELNPSNMFTTIAFQLASQDKYLEQKLQDIVKELPSRLQRSKDPTEQLQQVLLPLLKDEGRATHHVVIIVDALDESGGANERSKIIKPLVELPSKLPPGVQILLTTRPELDIQNILATSPKELWAQLSMEHLPNHATRNDICHYIEHMLKGHGFEADQIHKLVEKAQLSFQWASTACRYIVDQEDGNQAVPPSQRITHVLNSDTAATSQVVLYKLYASVMDAQFRASEGPPLEPLKLFLGIFVAARQPLSLDATLSLLHIHLSQHNNPNLVIKELERQVALLSSLITGAKPTDIRTPLLPLHASFLDFLRNSPTKYQVDVHQAHRLLIESCLSVMFQPDRGLRFNICNLPTSFSPNHLVPNLSGLIQNNIGDALCYACQFWTFHLIAVAPGAVTDAMWNRVKDLLSSTKLLHWLEVMSLTGASPLQTLSIIPAKVGSNIVLLGFRRVTNGNLGEHSDCC